MKGEGRPPSRRCPTQVPGASGLGTGFSRIRSFNAFVYKAPPQSPFAARQSGKAGHRAPALGTSFLLGIQLGKISESAPSRRASRAPTNIYKPPLHVLSLTPTLHHPRNCGSDVLIYASCSVLSQARS
ncbi:hypothetical protein P7K49_040654 [Saguinus oedipus]|uniref:Uncharacterized protein n=1 Tax=Saguinus oedipus TaxID=9490 RepID=A0ABQ9T970_SAGOE|nr:hypothetical protein P7K49_040654 [Saguinus oedipus]